MRPLVGPSPTTRLQYFSTMHLRQVGQERCAPWSVAPPPCQQRRAEHAGRRFVGHQVGGSDAHAKLEERLRIANGVPWYASSIQVKR